LGLSECEGKNLAGDLKKKFKNKKGKRLKENVVVNQIKSQN
jgi:hypothetical protein